MPESNRATELTELLRAGDEPVWSRLRELLVDKGLDPDEVIVAELFSDDNSLEFGLVVTPDHRVFQFDFDYLHKTIATAEFSTWRDLTTSWQNSPYDELVSAAFEIAN